MSIPPGEDIGAETHKGTDQILFLVEGEGEAITNHLTSRFRKRDVLFVTSGMLHNIRNTGKHDMKLFTVYAPPNHAKGKIHKTKADALNDPTDHYWADDL